MIVLIQKNARFRSKMTVYIDPSMKEEQNKNRIKYRNQWIKSEQNGFTDERKEKLIRPDYRPDLDPENPLYGTRIHQSPTKPLNSNHQTQSIRTAVNQPVNAVHQTNQSHPTEVQNIAKIERIDEEEEPSTQDSNLMSRNALI